MIKLKVILTSLRREKQAAEPQRFTQDIHPRISINVAPGPIYGYISSVYQDCMIALTAFKVYRHQKMQAKLINWILELSSAIEQTQWAGRVW